MDIKMPKEVSEVLTTLVTANAVEVENHLGDLPGPQKKQLVIEKVLSVIYDIADAFWLKFPDVIDNKVKQEYIPDLVDNVVDWLNSAGLFKHNNGGVM